MIALAKNLPTVSGSLGFLTEAGGMKALSVLVGGTKLGNAIEALTIGSDKLGIITDNEECKTDPEEN
ncbi:MAG: hypothetical protein ABH887_00155 [bacterium]